MFTNVAILIGFGLYFNAWANIFPSRVVINQFAGALGIVVAIRGRTDEVLE